MRDLGLVGLRKGRQFGLGGLLLAVSTRGDRVWCPCEKVASGRWLAVVGLAE
jgi:hypothetical protein